MKSEKKRKITIAAKFNDRRIYLNRNIPNDLFYINAGGISYPDKNYTISKHYSEHYSVQYVMSGSGYISYNNEKYPIQAGDMFYMCAEEGISYATNKYDPFTKIWINGRGRFWKMTFGLYGFTAPFGIVHADDRATEYFHRAFDISEKAEKDRSLGMTAINTIIGLMYDFKCGNITPRENSGEFDISCEIKKYIDLNLTTIKNLTDISRHFEVTPKTVYTKFKNTYNNTPTGYITECRLELAKEQLAKGNATVSDIAEKSGFSSASYFCKLFTKKYGISPQKYRRNAEDECKLQ